MNIIKRKLNILKKRKIDKKIDNLFSWIKGAELVELKSCNITEDPVRPEPVSYTHLTLPTTPYV